MMAALGITVPTAKLQDHKDYTLYGTRAAYKCFLAETVLILHITFSKQNPSSALSYSTGSV